MMWLTRLRRRDDRVRLSLFRRQAVADSLNLFSSRRLPFDVAASAAFLFESPMPRKPKITVVAERTEICKECRFSHHKRGDGLYCHRYPPVFVYDPSTGTSSPANPETNPDAWCGEFRGHLSS